MFDQSSSVHTVTEIIPSYSVIQHRKKLSVNDIKIKLLWDKQEATSILLYLLVLLILLVSESKMYSFNYFSDH